MKNIKLLILWPFFPIIEIIKEIKEWFCDDDDYDDDDDYQIPLPMSIFILIVFIVGTPLLLILNIATIWFTFWFYLAKDLKMKKRKGQKRWVC